LLAKIIAYILTVVIYGAHPKTHFILTSKESPEPFFIIGNSIDNSEFGILDEIPSFGTGS